MPVNTPPSYLSPYLSAASRHGGNFNALLWASPRTQELRFAALTRLVNLHNSSILDAGCGRADLLDYLIARRITPSRYVGLDGVPALADTAQTKRPERALIVRGDFVTDPMQLFVGADVVYFSGSLNTLDPSDFYATLGHAYQAAVQTLVFNFLASPALAGVSYLRWHPRAEVLAFASTLTKNVTLLDDYLDGDCTICLTKATEVPQ